MGTSVAGQARDRAKRPLRDARRPVDVVVRVEPDRFRQFRRCVIAAAEGRSVTMLETPSGPIVGAGGRELDLPTRLTACPTPDVDRRSPTARLIVGFFFVARVRLNRRVRLLDGESEKPSVTVSQHGQEGERGDDALRWCPSYHGAADYSGSARHGNDAVFLPRRRSASGKRPKSACELLQCRPSHGA